jgi:competence protein ComEA
MSYLKYNDQRSVRVSAAVFFTGLILSLYLAAVIFTNSGRVVSDRVAKLNPNTACAGELAELPSISGKKAQAIIDYRVSVNAGKAFENADDLEKVKGIGKKTVEKIRPWIEFNTD